MFLVRVIPIEKGVQKDMLTYFGVGDYTRGQLIQIPVRNKKISGIIHSVEPISSHKGDLKRLPYGIRKLSNQSSVPFFNNYFIEAVEKIAEHHATSIGAVIQALTPDILLSHPIASKIQPEKTRNQFEFNVFQADDDTRFAHYKSIIREEFALKHSVFILIPTAQDALFLKEKLEKGIENYTHVLYGAMTKKSILHTWKEICESDHPVLVIATGMFLSIPRVWKTIIIERESSRYYKMNSRPFLDMRTSVSILAEHIGATCIASDVFLRIETLVKAENENVQEISPLTWRSLASADMHMIDMREYEKKEGDKKMPFRVISDELNNLMQENKKTGRRLFIYVARRGLSPQIVCKDCGTTVLCEKCSAPVVLHTSAQTSGSPTRYFLCHTCGTKRTADELCKSCKSWNLESLGIGIEKIIESIGKIYRDTKIYRIDADVTPTAKKAMSVIEQFYENPGSILVGTDMALYYLKEPIEHVAIASLDALFSLPDFRIEERIFHTILRLRSLASHVFLAQTRHADNKLWQYAMKGNLIEFYRQEKISRKTFRYPPYATLVKITYEGEPKNVRQEMQSLKERFSKWSMNLFPAFIETKRGKFSMHALIRIEPKDWPDKELLEELRNLPPSYAVNIDPENLL